MPNPQLPQIQVNPTIQVNPNILVYQSIVIDPNSEQKPRRLLQPTIISRANEAPAKRDLLFESAANHAKQIGALGKGVMLIAGTLADGQAQTDVKVRVDGKTIDILPTELELTDGNHEVTSGYRTIGAVKVEQGKAIKVTVSYNDLRID